ncbi:amidohydrolase family protein [Noviherbaspirillum sedimenti]|uniref:Amidohydrolase-related domain-containing protein n=1 Tax=Noviherbaspirillum sedimenti TaxID=2320865 RepID=A0A3A3G5S6_9BURK|nr:amidohydrolase family protein [Noviherbaspirillum sedimenti]RJG03291.1 hypothetical protein D3878_18255 [Noviherbaspirillum sedimenti]
MLKLDAQVHVWYSDRPSRPWDPAYRQTNRDRSSFLQHAGQTNTPEMVLAEMAEAAVDGVLLTTLGVYGVNNELELAAAERDPERFQVIGVVDHTDLALADQLAAATKRGLLGIRVPQMRDPDRIARGEFDDVLKVCSDLRLVVMLPAVNKQVFNLIKRTPGVFFYMNHLGVGLAPPIVGFRHEAPFENLPAILELAELKNVGVKLTGLPALSVEAYPFRDIWPPILQVVAAFGVDRLSWGGDYTRTAGLHSYWEGANYLAEVQGLSEEQLAWLYAETLIQRCGWKRSAAFV